MSVVLCYKFCTAWQHYYYQVLSMGSWKRQIGSDKDTDMNIDMDYFKYVLHLHNSCL